MLSSGFCGFTTRVRAVREHAERAGWQIVAEFVDTAVSGRREKRLRIDALMDDARRRKFDLALVAASIALDGPSGIWPSAWREPFDDNG